jgi:hypothetical protein
MSKKQIQHGDVLIQEVDAIPQGVQPVPGSNGKIIVMAGETSGHNHIIDSSQATLWVLVKDGISQKYLKVEQPVTIYHDEHKPLRIPEGLYQIGRVQEYDYLTEMKRFVRD